MPKKDALDCHIIVNSNANIFLSSFVIQLTVQIFVLFLMLSLFHGMEGVKQKTQIYGSLYI